MTTTLIRRLTLSSALATLMVLGSMSGAYAEPHGGGNHVAPKRRLRMPRLNLRGRLGKARSWARSSKGKKFMKNAALVGGGIIVGAALANPAGAALVAGKALGVGLAVGKTAVSAAATVLGAKVSVGHAAAVGVAAYKGTQYGKRAAANGTSAFHELKQDAKRGFGLFNMFKRGDRSAAAAAPVTPTAAPVEVVNPNTPAQQVIYAPSHTGQ